MLAATIRRLGKPPRIASFIVTIWGDAVVPRGGSLWIGTLHAILDRFGCNEGQTRTAMSRLTAEGWLTRSRRGRLSFYRLGPRGEAVFGAAASRIYDPPCAAWDGAFRLLVADDPALAPPGFVALAPGVLIGTAGALPDAAPALFATPRSGAEAVAIASRAWSGLPALGDAYRRFAAGFAPLLDAAPPPAEALPLRLLLVHEYRRVALRDPDLPPALLPPGWPGGTARAIAAALYRRLLPASEAWLTDAGRAEDGPLPPAGPDLAARFRDAPSVTDFLEDRAKP